MTKAKVANNEKHRVAIKKFLVTLSLKRPRIGDEENKNYSGNAEKPNNLAMLSIENEIATSTDFKNILQEFANKKTRRVFFLKSMSLIAIFYIKRKP